MEDNPVKIERKDGKIQGLFVFEEWRDMDENKARDYYNSLSINISQKQLELEKMYRDIEKFGDVFNEENGTSSEEIVEETLLEDVEEQSEDIEQ